MYCRKCGKQLEEDSVFCSSCGTKVAVATETFTPSSTPTPPLVQSSGANLEAKDLSAREIAAIQAKLSSHRHNQTGWGVASLIGVFCIVSAGINPNTGLLVAGIAWIVFCLIMVAVYGTRHGELQRKLEGEGISEPVLKESRVREKSSHVGVRYGDGEHQWQVLVNGSRHVVTLQCGFQHTLMLDDDVIESINPRSSKTYNFEIDGEGALVTSRVSSRHGSVHKLFVSGKKVG